MSGTQLNTAVEEAFIQIPGAPSALAARLIERMGFEAVYLSGAAFSAGDLAIPDVGLFTLTELAEQTRRLSRATSAPIIVDADTGFGDALNVERTVGELIHAGASAIQLEDQQLPKRCGHLSGKTLVEPSVMCAKIRAAVAACGDADVLIIARTDARADEGIDAAIARAQQYIDAGADWIFPEALQDKREFEAFIAKIDVPLLANMTEFGKSPLLSADTLAEMGYAAALYPVTLMRVAMKAMEACLAIMGAEGTQESMLDMMQDRSELYDLLGYQDYEKRDQSYFTQSE
ncbi:MAG: methylisocitrate lyase [bacterium]|nr:methylisocitrate lyase [bacterium]